MQSGDLVKFKVHHYHKSYGLGVILAIDKLARMYDGPDGNRRWALFNGERIVVRLDELELVNEAR